MANNTEQCSFIVIFSEINILNVIKCSHVVSSRTSAAEKILKSNFHCK